MDAPMPAARLLYEYSPANPAAPRPIPIPSAIFGFNPFTNGLWLVLIIFLSSSTSMYWLSAWVDIDNATDAARSGQHENVTGYKEYDPIVTIPFNKDNLNFVSYRPCFNILFLLRVENIALFTIFSIINIRILLIYSPF